MGTWTPGPGATSGNDTFTGDSADEVADGLAGNDVLVGDAGNDTLTGNSGDDTLDGGDGDDVLNDTSSSNGVANISGGAGNDAIQVNSVFTSGVIDGGADVDSLFAYGNISGITIQNIETLYTNGFTVTGTAAQFESFDAIQYSSVFPTFSVGLALSSAGTMDLSDELLGHSATISGSTGNDVITSSDGNDSLNGGNGDDTLNGGDGNDTLIGGNNNDVLDGGAGNDILSDTSSGGAAAMSGGDGSDRFDIVGIFSGGVLDGGADADELVATNTLTLAGVTVQNVETLSTSFYVVEATAAAFESFDTIRYSNTELTLGVNLRLSEAGTIDLIDETLGRQVTMTGSSGDDNITTGAENDTLHGQGGSDVLSAGAGNDTITDTSGSASTIDAGDGDDLIQINGAGFVSGTIDGGAGDDQITAYSNLGGVVFQNIETLNTNNQTVVATAAQLEAFDTIRRDASNLASNVSLTLSEAGTVDLADELLGRTATLNGSSGNDNITAGAGNDVLNGQAGNDTLFGGDGNDTITDTSGTAVTADAGAGDDAIILNNASTFASGTIDGGAGDDQITVWANVSGLTFQNIETLNTSGQVVTGTAAQFEAFDTIRRDASNLASPVSLTLSEAGTVDLADELLGRAATLNGSSGDDTITAGAGNDVLNGQGGDDTLFGGDGNDTISDTSGTAFSADAGAGDDTIIINNTSFAAGTIDGGAGADQITAYGNLGGLTFQNIETLNLANQTTTGTAAQFEAFDTIRRDGANLTSTVSLILAEAGTVDLTDELLGRAVTFNGSSGNDGMTASNGNDSLAGNDGDDTLNGGLGNDNLSGNNGDDTLIGGDGNDILTGHAGANAYVGGAGNDTINENNASGVASIDAGDDDDIINASNVSYTTGLIDGGAGTDQINGSGANFGTVSFQNVEFLNTNNGNVTATAAAFEAFGTIRRDSVNLSSTVQLTLYEAGAVDLTSQLLGRAVIFTGSSGNDSITSSDGADTLNGVDGDDTLNGGLGNDFLNGGAGDDTLNGGDGADTLTDTDSTSGVAALFGGDGDDTIIINNAGSSGFSTGTVNGGAGNDQVTAHGSLGSLVFQDMESLNTSGNLVTATADQFESFSTIRYSSAALANNVSLALTVSGSVDLQDELLGRSVTFQGASGNDTIRLSNGSDQVYGNDGDDILFAGVGVDQLYGGAGVDAVYGEAGNDYIYVSNSDFAAGETFDGGADADTLYLSGVGLWDLRLATINSIEAIGFLGGAASNVHQVELYASQIGSGFALDAVISGDSLTDDQIRVTMQSAATLDLSAWTFNNWSTNDTIDRVLVVGSGGADQITGSRSDDDLSGGAGDDVLEGGRGNDVLNGGLGVDTASYASATIGVIVGLTNFATYNTVGAGIDVIIDIENLIGSDHNDVLSGNALTNTLSGGNGQDALFGLDGDDVLEGGAGADVLDGGQGADEMTGGTGDDIYVVDNSGDTVVESANEGLDLVQATLSYTLGSNVENLDLLGVAAINGVGNALDNVITGNGAANILIGDDGDDTLDGGGDADAMSGGLGNDTYMVADLGDAVIEEIDEGTDLVRSSIDIASLFDNVENLTLLGAATVGGGNALNNLITGGDGGDQLSGFEGDDTLDGGEGDDNLAGGLGNDVFVVDSVSDSVVEAFGEGFDTVEASVSYVLSANVEQLVLTGVSAINGDANGLANTLLGNEAANVLYGRAGNDTINANGGADTLYGGDGDDTLNGGDGNDVIDAGLNTDTLNGGAGDDVLYGRGGNDTLDGGLGADQMFGGAGDDTYIVDEAGDVVAESPSAGNDTVLSAVTYALGAYLENLTLTGAGANDGVGNILANTIIGNDAANVLSGLAGADTLSGSGGQDTLFGGNGSDSLSGGDDDDTLDGGNDADDLDGGAGADTLLGRSASDVINGGTGEDTVFGGDGDDTIDGGDDDDLLDGGNGNDGILGGDGADTLYGRQNNDTLSGGGGADTLYGGDGDDNLAGGEGDDVLEGGNGVDRLNGGLGADLLWGGAGADTYVFDSALGAGNVDTILYFSVAEDFIELSEAIFGTLSGDWFTIGPAASSADHRIIYDATTGALYFDADGDGAGGAVQFATLTTGLLGLSDSNFVGGP